MTHNTTNNLPTSEPTEAPAPAAELYETPRLLQTGSLRNVLGKSHGSTEIVNRFRIAGHKH
jgi:hypothetical protein